MPSGPPLGFDPAGFLFPAQNILSPQKARMTRVNFLIDGFNLYHSTREAQHILKTTTKWLDVKRMLFSYHMMFAQIAKSKVQLGDIFYFSAFAHHRESIDPGVVSRHKALLSCFKDTGITVQMHQFKEKQARCPKCGYQWAKHEEKETDVAIALKIIELFVRNACDMAVIVSGDTDLAPAVNTAKGLFPDKRVIFAFPGGRKNKSLINVAPGSFKMKSSQYLKFQFPDPYCCADGKLISKPATW